MKRLASLAIVFAVCVSLCVEEKEREKPISGPQKGESISPFKVIAGLTPPATRFRHSTAEEHCPGL